MEMDFVEKNVEIFLNENLQEWIICHNFALAKKK